MHALRPIRVLLLGGSTEASRLASMWDRDPRIAVIVSLAGHTTGHVVPFGHLRTGGFGGASGLSAYLRAEVIDIVVDATHPFAAIMPFNAAQACHETSTPLLKVRRPAWSEQPGDRWIHVPSPMAAATVLAEIKARRVFLTTGRRELDPFRRLMGISFVVRSIEAPDLTGFADATPLLMRGPFDLPGERQLLADYTIDTLVTKNSGGSAAAAKIQAARERAVRVVMIDRPPMPGVEMVESIEAASAWLGGQLDRLGTSVV